jgi:glycosyltransferase involved in cell wall biosynthesis
MKIAVLGVQPKYFIRPNNTDWRHNLFLENAFSKIIYPGNNSINFSLRNSAKACLAMNIRHLRGSLGRHLNYIKQSVSNYHNISLFMEDRIERYDVVYSYGCYPNNSPKPVVWHTGPTYTHILRQQKVKQLIIEDEIAIKASCAKKAALIAVSSEIAAIDFDLQFPGHKDKIVVLPFVLPQVNAENEDNIRKKQSMLPIKILFVGRESHRKGLDLLLHAYQRVKLITKETIELTIVSNFTDGKMSLPQLADVKHHQSLDHKNIQILMREAHIFAMPSRQESFGLVYLEAMAGGSVCIGPAREPQISLFGNGRYGLPCEVTTDGVFNALSKLVLDAKLREKIAIDSVRLFNANYSIENVLLRYQEAFFKAAKTTKNLNS